MFVEGITCSGIDERNSIPETVQFLKKFPGVELGVQCHKRDFEKRSAWLEGVGKACETYAIEPKIALHLNEKYALDFCENTFVENPVYLWLQREYLNGNPVISRVQINFVSNPSSLYPTIIPNIEKLKKQIKSLNKQRVILPYSKESKDVIRALYHKVPFDILFDESFGSGTVSQRQSPLFPDIYQGYAGGLGPDNILEELEKIAKLAHQDIFVDAESKLQEEKIFSFQKAEEFVSKIVQFNKMAG